VCVALCCIWERLAACTVLPQVWWSFAHNCANFQKSSNSRVRPIFEVFGLGNPGVDKMCFSSRNAGQLRYNKTLPTGIYLGPVPTTSCLLFYLDLSLSQDVEKLFFGRFCLRFTFYIINEAHKQYSLSDTGFCLV
jgi:hypothetical protein